MNRAQSLDVIEDLQFLDSTGTTATEAARRCGFPSTEALEKWLDRHGKYDLWKRFKHREAPGNHNHKLQRKERQMHSIQPSTSRPIQTAPDAGGIIDRGESHDSKRIQAAASRAVEALDRLRELLRAADAKAAEKAAETERKARARARVEALEDELAKAKAALHGKAPAAKPKPAPTQSRLAKGEHPCETCERIFDTAQGRALHQRRAHGDLQGDLGKRAAS